MELTGSKSEINIFSGDDHGYFKSSEDANQVFAVPNCW